MGKVIFFKDHGSCKESTIILDEFKCEKFSLQIRKHSLIYDTAMQSSATICEVSNDGKYYQNLITMPITSRFECTLFDNLVNNYKLVREAFTKRKNIYYDGKYHKMDSASSKDLEEVRASAKVLSVLAKAPIVIWKEGNWYSLAEWDEAHWNALPSIFVELVEA